MFGAVSDEHGNTWDRNEVYRLVSADSYNRSPVWQMSIRESLSNISELSISNTLNVDILCTII